MRVIYAGGGTGGHINPAISIADYAKEKDKENKALFIGTKEGLEKRLVPKAGYDIEYIDVVGFDRRNLLKNIDVVKRLIKAKRDCKKIIKSFKPDCIVCTGGYVSGPVMMAAKASNIPSLIHEQNVYPGLTVKGSQKYADYLALSFKETINHMSSKEKCVVTGNPVRLEIINADRDKAREKLLIKNPLVLVFGGSLGAKKINDTVIEMLDMIGRDKKFTLVFGTGERNYEDVISTVEARGITLGDNIKIVPYIDNIADYMAASDIVVSRSGAITVSEIAVLKKPSILIPSPNVVRNHQEQNAREFEKSNAAALILESELTPEILYDKITGMLSDSEKLLKMSDNLSEFSHTDALDKIYKLMIDMKKRRTE